MSSITLFDRAFERYRTAEGGKALHLAERLAETLLGEVKYLWELYFSINPDKDREAEILLRHDFEQWAAQTGEALKRLEPMARNGAQVGGCEQLGHEYGRVRAMISVSLADLEEAREQVRSGRTTPLEEVKRELRLRRQRQSEGGSHSA